MSKVCPNCSRSNPDLANYCYFDGICLPGATQHGPVDAGTAAFSHPFVFANGEVCRNFNQFVMGCQRNWGPARDLLKQGGIQQFFTGMGRADLAQAAAQATASLDADRALDELLGKLPADVLQPAKLAVEPTQVNLGKGRPGTDATFDVVVSNLGMRLLMGRVTTDCDWLVLGEAGQKQKIFQTTAEANITVTVKGQKLRAGPKPMLGRLMVDSNAGSASVRVQVDVPIVPFPLGILQGAITPREIAVKAKQFPREAAVLFEQGAVNGWYQSNGWIYPVEGPSGSGLGAVQQFFEALGLTKPPRVEISDADFKFKGTTGDKIPGRLKVTTPDKRPVFAHAVCDQPWVKFAPPQFQGATVRLPFEVEVPPNPGETLTAKVTVRANGNQRFQVPISLAIDNVFLATAEPVLEISAADIVETEPIVTEALEDAPADQVKAGSPFAGLREKRNDAVVDLPKAYTRKRIEAEARKKPVQAGPESEVVGSFGMGRLVYWASVIGGWSAFVGWMFAEIAVGRWVGDSVLCGMLMVVIVASALGAGLSQVEGLLSAQWFSLKRLGPGLLGGFLGGLVGGLFAFLIYGLMKDIPVLRDVSRVLGWTLLGMAIGVCEGLLQMHWRRIRNGLIGGGIGGFLGGLLFSPVSWWVGSDVSSRAFGFVVLGLFIGLFIALVQVLLKEAWLIVEEGFRPGRELILNQPLITMGTSEKASLIFIAYGAKGIEPVHTRIRQNRNGEYVLEDNDTRTGTRINGEPADGPFILENGDLIELGINKVRFHERVRAKGRDE